MVAQEQSSPSNTGKVGPSQQRKSLMAAAIRRGEVKISEPILWVEGVPSTSNQASVSAVVERPQEQQSTTDAAEREDENQIHGLAISTDDARPQSRDGSSIIHKQSLSNGGREGVNSQVPASAHASITSHPLIMPMPVTPTQSERKGSIFVEDGLPPPTPAAMEKKKARRSGTLRTVLRSVFGRKKKRQSEPVASPPPSRAGVKHEHTRSDPIPSQRPKQSSTLEYARAVSTNVALHPLQEVEYDGQDAREESRQTPVQHMLPFPMNINAPQPESPERTKLPNNYLSFETSPQVHRRRATLPSMILSADGSTTIRKMWSTTDLSPVGSPSYDAAQGGFGMPDPPIGSAISSLAAHPNRRSRSAGALHELSKQHERSSYLQRKSSEIKLWRASKIDSQQDSHHGSQQGSHQGLHFDVYNLAHEDIIPTDSPHASSTGMAMTEISEVTAENGSVHEGEPQTPLEYGSVTGEPEGSDSTIEAGMEQRLALLETTMHRLSMSVQDYTTVDGEVQPPTEREFALKSAPRALSPHIVFVPPTPSRQASTADIADAPQQYASMRFTQSMRTIPSPSPSKGSSNYQRSFDSSTTTAVAPASPPVTYLQPNTLTPSSAPPAPLTNSLTATFVTQSQLRETLAPLHLALRHERLTRKALEARVESLTRDLAEMSALVAKLRKEAARDTIYAGPRSPRGSPVKGTERSRFSGYDSTDEMDTDDETGHGMMEAWKTPMEERNEGWGFENRI